MSGLISGGVSGSHFVKRLQVIYQEMKIRSWSSAWITSPANLFYITGFLCHPHERFLGLYLTAESEEAILFVPALDYETAKSVSRICRIIPISDQENPYEVITSAIGVIPRGDIVGLEKGHVSVSKYESLAGVHSGAIFGDIGPLLTGLRMVKSPEEADELERAVDMAESALVASLPYVRAGVSELELAAEISYRLREAGSEKVSSPMVLFGSNSALPHGHTGHYRLQPNDFVMIDFGAYSNGYGSDLTRTFVLGEGTEEQAWIYEMVLEANTRAIRSVCVGQPYGVVDRAARELIDGHNYGSYFNHRTGHGLGLELHEEPSIHGDCTTLISPGHLFTIEPGIYVPGLGGVRIEDDIYVEPNGKVKVLSKLSKKLQRL
ncbi:Xaa-Pro peptidase family protein [Cohnella sp. WQ 127256]|uniref:M24 family metallopeptidase n=1 Tax=Cohnella sp. WQ 127256 TaxID=2938790 RepID=UPI00211779AD|nr:Xaa-Pro peptidase family protein [Cohnella sp. WQ 127256]